MDAVVAQTEIDNGIQMLKNADRKSPSGCPWQTYDVAYHRWFPTTVGVARALGATNRARQGDNDDDPAQIGMYVFDEKLYDAATRGLIVPRKFGT